MNAPSTNGSNGQPYGVSRGLAASGVDVRALPQNVDAEASVLGGVILKNEVLEQLSTLETDDFFALKHKIVWQAIRNLETANKPIDVVTLEVEIENVGKLDAIGGVAFLGELTLRVPTVDNVVAYAELVRRAARNRQAILTLASALDRAKTWKHEPEEMILEVAGDLQRIEAGHVSALEAKKARWCVPLEAFLGDEEPDDDDAQDWIIRDLIPRGEPMLWGGPMKGGKTWAAMDLLISLALGESWLGKFENTLGPARVVGLFLEDNERRIRKRLWELCRARGISPNHVLLRENLRISRAPIRLPDPGHQRRLTAELKNWGAKFAIVDNLTRVMVGDPNKTTDAAGFTRAWMEVNDESGCAIGFLHHTKKPSGDQKSSTADPFDQLRGSGDFGATARNIVVTTPIRTEGEMMAEVRMRGNLDLRRDSFVLGFERKEQLGRWQARLFDRGAVEDVKSDVHKQRKESKESKRREDAAAELVRRQEIAVAIATREGSISQFRLAKELGLASARSAQPTLNALVDAEVLTHAGKRGYELVKDQVDLPV